MASPLTSELLRRMDAYWRAANYLSVGQIYLFANPLLRQPLKREHVKPRLLGHWGTTPGRCHGNAHAPRIVSAGLRTAGVPFRLRRRAPRFCHVSISAARRGRGRATMLEVVLHASAGAAPPSCALEFRRGGKADRCTWAEKGRLRATLIQRNGLSGCGNALDRSRTCNPRFRRPMLYPIELRVPVAGILPESVRFSSAVNESRHRKADLTGVGVYSRRS
jgi:hypothetical protein